MTEPLKIDWYPNLKDARYAVRRAFWGTPGRAIRNAIFLFLFPGILCASMLDFATDSYLSTAQLAMVAIGCGLLWGILVVEFFGAWLSRNIVKDQLAKGNPQQIIVSDEGVERVLKESNVKHPWAGIARVEETPLMFILFGSSGPLAAIEKSGIPSETELRMLRALLRDKKPGKYLDEGGT